MKGRAPIGFWAHQLVEYLLGFMLLSLAIRLTGPAVVPTIVGGLLLVSLAASTDGPLGALRLVGRKLHRRLDVAVAVALAASPLVFGFGNVMLVAVAEGMALAMVVLVRRTTYFAPSRRQRRAEARAVGGADLADRAIDAATRAATARARAAGEVLGRVARDGPTRLGRFVGRHRR
ncbi:MAG: hypothetical protein AB1673_06450 [Actinomycetota bacterium]